MNTRRSLAAALAASFLLAGCASVEKKALAPESRSKIKTVAVIAVTEPEKYFLNPGQATAGAALYLFGAIGGLVLGTIEAARFESATNEFTAAVKPTNPNVAQHWNETIVNLLQSRGYEVVQFAQLPKKSDGKELDCTSIAGKADAVLISTISTGYVVESKVEPNVFASIRLASSNCSETYFSDGILYSSKPHGKHTHITRDSKFTFQNRDAIKANPLLAKEAFHTGLTEVAKRATSDL